MRAPADPTGRRLALLIAASDYTDPDLRKLRAPGRDASELAIVLGDRRIGGFDVQTLINAQCSDLQVGIEEFCADRHPADQLLIYLSCHGLLDDNGRLYYAAANTRRRHLAATAVAAAWLNERFEDCRARCQILVLDCCHSGAFARDAKGEPGLALRQRFESAGRGRVVLTASGATEYSFEGDQTTGEGVPSVFTRAIIDGLTTGDADRDGDGLITVADLYQHVYGIVHSAEPRQTPELWTYRSEGDLLIAHSVRGPVLQPASAGPAQREHSAPGHHAEQDAKADEQPSAGEPGDGWHWPGRRLLAIAAAAAAVVAIGTIAAVRAWPGAPAAVRNGWPYDAGGAVYTRPFVISGVVYVGSDNGHIYALNDSSGALLWKYPQAGHVGAVNSRPGVADHRVYAGSDDGHVYAVDAASGRQAWQPPYDTRGRVRASPLFVEGVVYIDSGSGYFYALNAATGRPEWRQPVWLGPGAGGSSPGVSAHGSETPLGDIAIYVGGGDGHFHALNAATGVSLWRFPAKARTWIGAAYSQPSVSPDGRTVYVGLGDGHIYALNAADGTRRWEFPAPGQPSIAAVDSQPAVSADGLTVYLASGRSVFALNATNGRLWSSWRPDPVRLPSAVGNSGPVVTQNGSVYIGSGADVYCLDAADGGFCWSRPFQTSSRVVTTPVINNNGDVYVGTQDGNVYALTASGSLVGSR